MSVTPSHISATFLPDILLLVNSTEYRKSKQENDAASLEARRNLLMD
jgi:hypothetical protein